MGKVSRIGSKEPILDGRGQYNPIISECFGEEVKCNITAN